MEHQNSGPEDRDTNQDMADLLPKHPDKLETKVLLNLLLPELLLL